MASKQKGTVGTMSEAKINAEAKRRQVFGASHFKPLAKRSMFGPTHLIREVERTAYCGAAQPRGFIDKADHIVLDYLCQKCRTAFEAEIADA